MDRYHVMWLYISNFSSKDGRPFVRSGQAENPRDAVEKHVFYAASAFRSAANYLVWSDTDPEPVIWTWKELVEAYP